MSCILGAILYCTGFIAIPGPLATLRPMPQHAAWNYAVYGAPVLQPQSFPVAFGITRRG